MKKQLLFIFHSWIFLILIIFTPGNSCLSAQDSNSIIRGKVLQLNTNTGLNKASVFINGTSYGTICTDSGSFTLPHYPQPPFILTVTAIGFETKQTEVTGNMLKQELVIYMMPRAELLQDVEVRSPERNGWLEYGSVFLEQFIGYSDFAKQCKLLNKEVLDFYYDKNERTLEVIARAPLIIRNEAIGYQVTYWLEEFLYHFKTTRLIYKGYSKFDLLTSKKKQTKWEINRAFAYHGSVNHFMRSVYNGKTAEQGFEIRVLKRIKEDERENYFPAGTDTFDFNNEKGWTDVSPERNRSKINFSFNGDANQAVPGDKEINISGDPVIMNKLKKQIDQKEKERYITILYNTSIPVDSIRTINEAGEVMLRFDDFLLVTYTKEQAEEPYKKRYAGVSGKQDEQLQESIISLPDQMAIFILPDGNFYDAYNLQIENYWNYEKLDKLMPLDYSE